MKKEVEIAYLDADSQERPRICSITDLRATAGEEFLIDEKGWELRLDQLISVDGKKLSEGYCGF